MTPEVVVLNFLQTKEVAEPIQYILFSAHSTRAWLPLWYYVRAARITPENAIDLLKRERAGQSTHREKAIKRLMRRESAYKLNAGKPKSLLNEFSAGMIAEPTGDQSDSAFALAVQGLPDGQNNLDRFRSLLLGCFYRAQSDSQKDKNRRSSIYRAACRLDELMYSETMSQ